MNSHTILEGKVAVVAGATRGAGRGIARSLAEAGATVYCTGRSTRASRSPYGRPETIEETAELIQDAKGIAVAKRVDHTNENEVSNLFADIGEREGRLDVLVNTIAGEDPIMKQHARFWEADYSQNELVFRQGFTAHMITAKHAAKIMVRDGSGLIVEVVDADMLGGGGYLAAQMVKTGHKFMALNMASELAPNGVAAVAVTPGYLRSEATLEYCGVTEENWRDYGETDPNFLESETPMYVGRAIAALANDSDLMARTGQLLSSWQLSREYGFTDVDGRRPDWGALDVDYSTLPADDLEYFRIAAKLEQAWTQTIAGRTAEFIKSLP